MAAKKQRRGAGAARKPKKRAGRPVKKTKKARAKPKAKARTKPKVRPATDILDVPPWGNSFEAAAQIAMRPRTSNAVLSTLSVVGPSLALRTSDPNALHTEMIEQIETLERAMADLRKHQRRRGIGDNNPPEPIEPAPLSEKELAEISKAMVVLKKQPPSPTPPSNKAKAAVRLLMKFGDRLRPLSRAAGAYLAKQADNFVTEAVKEAGKRIVQSPFWLPIIYKLPALADIAHRWLEALPHL